MADIETSAAHALLLDAFDRIHGLVVSVADGLSIDEATYRPDAEANSIAWLLWHLSRNQDDHIADVAGVEQAYVAKGWHEKLALPFHAAATGYGHSTDDVAAVRVETSLLAAYHSDVHALTTRFLARLETDEFDRIVDTSWDPPVTMSVRLVSVVGDGLQHVGQAAYLRGIVERRR